MDVVLDEYGECAYFKIILERRWLSRRRLGG
jgi:hypothetical protein